jgi:hypothetical protein
MSTKKRDTILYWVLTILVLAPTGASGIPELFMNGPDATVRAFQVLGYPLYLMKILGFSKILGSIAILDGRYPKLKEWAYAGFAFDFLGATASHLLAGDSAHAPFPFIFFILLMGSYVYSNRRDAAQAAKA